MKIYTKNYKQIRGVESHGTVVTGGSSIDIRTQTTRHPFHIVTPSPWPLITAFFALLLTFGTAFAMHYQYWGRLLAYVGLAGLIFCVYRWWSDVIFEGHKCGNHTELVQRGLRIGMVLFIVSEIMFFFAFFWAFFHSSLAPAMDIGFIWPPKGIKPFCPVSVPFLNTLILLTSGAFVTWAHHLLEVGKHVGALHTLWFTVALGVLFTALQYYEYGHAEFKISDGIYGCLFYMLTGFHGFHVLVGTIFLVVCALRIRAKKYRLHHFVGFEAAIWYWHFVDVVWLFLFVSIYWWGGGRPHAA